MRIVPKLTDSEVLYFAMKERAVMSVALKIKSLLSEQWGPLTDAGWSEAAIKAILQNAIEKCSE